MTLKSVRNRCAKSHSVLHVAEAKNRGPRPSFRLWTGATNAACRGGYCACGLCVDQRPLARQFFARRSHSGRRFQRDRFSERVECPPPALANHGIVAMSALPPKADMCSALLHVCFGPIADSCTAAISILIQSTRRRWRPPLAAPGCLALAQYER